jgi:ABC-2 type transport system permease protein
MDVSPFAHSPVLPGPNAAMMGTVWLTLVAEALIAIGSAAFRRCDLAG